MLRKVTYPAVMLLGAQVVQAAEQAAASAQAAVPAQGAFAVSHYFSSTVIATLIGLGLAAGLCGIGQGLAVYGALSGISRQPEATPKIQLNMIIGLAFIESLVLYTLFIAIVLLFVNPFTKYIVG